MKHSGICCMRSRERYTRKIGVHDSAGGFDTRPVIPCTPAVNKYKVGVEEDRKHQTSERQAIL